MSGAPQAPLTEYEHALVREAWDVVEPCAARVAKKFRRFVRADGMMTPEDLVSIGWEALVQAARAYDEKYNREFVCFGRHIVRFRMLDAVGDLIFHGRLNRAASMAEDNYCAHQGGDDYNVMKHDGQEAKRRYRAFANGLFAATFMAAMEEAVQCLDESEGDDRREFEQSLEILRATLACFDEKDRQILALVYRDLVLLKDVSEQLGVPYSTVRARHTRVLKVLHELLTERGITHAPRPLVVPDAGDLFPGGSGAQNDTGTGSP
jgi:RNA polymerase sigma factor (sigma-70 family)